MLALGKCSNKRQSAFAASQNCTPPHAQLPGRAKLDFRRIHFEGVAFALSPLSPMRVLSPSPIFRVLAPPPGQHNPKQVLLQPGSIGDRVPRLKPSFKCQCLQC